MCLRYDQQFQSHLKQEKMSEIQKMGYVAHHTGISRVSLPTAPRSPLTTYPPPTGVRCTYIFPVSAFRQPYTSPKPPHHPPPPYRCPVYSHLSRVRLPTAVHFPEAPSPPHHPTTPYRCQVYLHLSRVRLPTAVDFPEAPPPPPPPYRCQVYLHLSRVSLPTAVYFPESPSPPLQVSGVLTSFPCQPSDSRRLPRSPLTTPPPYRCQVYSHLSRVCLPTAVHFPEAPSPPTPPTGVRCTHIFPVSAFRQP